MGCVVVNDMEYGFTHVWDQDGLWVGRFFDHPVISPASPLSAYEQCGENFGGSVFTNESSGEVFYVGGGINACPVYRISDWNDFHRQTGSMEISAAAVASLTKRTQAEALREDVAHFAFIEQNKVKIDGDLAKWKAIKPLIIKDGGKDVVRLYLAWNSEYLYATFDIAAKTPWKNASKAELAFQGGAQPSTSIMALSQPMPNQG